MTRTQIVNKEVVLEIKEAASECFVAVDYGRYRGLEKLMDDGHVNDALVSLRTLREREHDDISNVKYRLIETIRIETYLG